MPGGVGGEGVKPRLPDAEGQVSEIVLGLESAEGNAPSAEDTVQGNCPKAGWRRVPDKMSALPTPSQSKAVTYACGREGVYRSGFRARWLERSGPPELRVLTMQVPGPSAL